MMLGLQVPANYESKLDLLETERAIKFLKDSFERGLADALNLQRVSAPLFVPPESGLNDNLSGRERPVSFDILETGRHAEIVHSLAKWKRFALHRYGFSNGQGLYTDMNAIRRDEACDNLHSLYVDQWDWECVISRHDRTLDFLYDIVRRIYKVFWDTQLSITQRYPHLTAFLPQEIHFLTSQELEDRYPSLSPSQRELQAVREYGAVFVSQIGGHLRSGLIHDTRAPDYDDWQLNGDILFHYPLLDRAFEISSMGIRVDEQSLQAQLAESGCLSRATMPFQQALLGGALPLTIGGGIGQSRLCMFFLNKAHIGEVQASLWPQSMSEACEQNGIVLL